MSEMKKWLEEGHRLEEQGQYVEAIGLFEKAAFDEKTVPSAVDRLLENWTFANLQFADKLLEIYPKSVAAVRLKVTLLHRVSAYSSAYRLCSAFLKDYLTVNDTQVLHVKKLRLRSAILGRITDNFVDDAITVFASISASNVRGQYQFLTELLSATSVEFEQAFIQLSQENVFPHVLRSVFEQKANLLRALLESYK